jgi:hypothetical protein
MEALCARVPVPAEDDGLAVRESRLRVSTSVTIQ